MVQMRTCTHAPAPPKLIQMESVFKYSFLVRRSSASCIQSSNQFHRKNKNKMETRIFTGSPHTDKRSSLEHLELGTRVHFTCVHTRAQRTVITEIKCLASSCEPAHSANTSVGSSEISKKLVFFPRSPFLFRRDDDLLPHIYFNMFLHFIISRYSLSIPLCLHLPLFPSCPHCHVPHSLFSGIMRWLRSCRCLAVAVRHRSVWLTTLATHPVTACIKHPPTEWTQ